MIKYFTILLIILMLFYIINNYRVFGCGCRYNSKCNCRYNSKCNCRCKNCGKLERFCRKGASGQMICN
jgi:hypothetical protein